MNVIFVYYSNPYRKSGGVSVSSCVMIEEFSRRGINCYAAYRYGANCDREHPNLYGELILPNDNIDHKDNIIALAKFIANHKIDLIINQGGAFGKVTRLCTCVKAKTEVKLFSVVHCDPKEYLLNAISPIKTPLICKGIMPVLERLFRIALLPFLYARAYLKSRRFFLLAYRKSEAVICLSEANVKTFLAITGIRGKGSKLHAIANSLEYIPSDKEIFNLNKVKNVIFVGRLQNSIKRIDLLLQVWRRVQGSLPGWVLHILGEGRDGKVLHSMALSLGLENVHFVGHVNPRGYLEKASILCMTSLSEGFPRVLIEAQAYGVVPIAYKSFSAVHDIIDDGKTGILVTPFSIEEYARKLVDLANDETKRRQIALRAWIKSNDYASSNIGDRWMELLAKNGLPV